MDDRFEGNAYEGHGGRGGDARLGLPKSAMAITSLVLGIVALASSPLPIVNNASALVGALGAIFGVVGLVGTIRGKKSGKGLAIAGLALSVVAIAVVLATQSLYSAAIDEALDSASLDGVVAGQTGEGAAGGSEATQGDAVAQDEGRYVISDETFVDNGYGSYAITGTFRNTSGEELSYVQLSYRMLDAEGAQIGTAYANTSNLVADGVWKFEAVYFNADTAPASFELADVTGF